MLKTVEDFINFTNNGYMNLNWTNEKQLIHWFVYISKYISVYRWCF